MDDSVAERLNILLTTDAGDTTGIGGHLYSFRALVEALAPLADCTVAVFGCAQSPPLADLPCPTHRVEFGPGRLRRRELARFSQIVEQVKPDVIHAFDPIAGAFARAAARRTGCGLLLTKCGGPDPAARAYPWGYFPRVPRLIVYSRENEDYFRSRRAFRGTQIRRIPNRIGAVAADADKVAALRARLDPVRPVILRIGRISPSYFRTAEMSIRLAERLASDGVPVQLVFLGAVQNAQTEQAIRERLGPHGAVISDPDLTGQASAVLDAGDLVVGTGRGLMEAAARGRPLLVPARSGRLPALVNERNWQTLFDGNFSERSEAAGWDEERNYANIRQALTDPAARRRLSAFSRTLYEDQFAMERVMDLYRSVYEDARAPERGGRIDQAKHWLWMLWRAQARPLAAAADSAAGTRETP
jgi:glycosyltransferase involved in cell wall biosynthesis